jgi:hypothetical protein
MKYVEMNLCCFIPGKVIDEIFRVLRVIKEDQLPPMVIEILKVCIVTADLFHLRTGLPVFSCYNLPKRVNYTKLP